MRRAAIISFALLLAAGPVLAGPPWIRVRLPQDHDAALARGGFLLIRTVHHGTLAPLHDLSARVWMLRNGRVVAESLVLDRTDSAYLLMVRRSWSGPGPVVLSFASADGHGGAGLAVGVDGAGRAVWAVVPLAATGVSRAPTEREVRRLLEALATGREPPRLADASWMAPLARENLLPLGLALLLAPVLVRAIHARRRHVPGADREPA